MEGDPSEPWQGKPLGQQSRANTSKRITRAASTSPSPSTEDNAHTDLKRTLSAGAQRMVGEMKQKAIEAQQIAAASKAESDLSDDSESDETFICRLKFRPMSPISEESRSSISYNFSPEDNPIRRGTHTRSVLRKLPHQWNERRVASKITELHEYVEDGDAVHRFFHDRLRYILGVFVDFKGGRKRGEWQTLIQLDSLDKEVQAAHAVQDVIKEATHLLLHVDKADFYQDDLRRWLYLMELLSKPSKDRDPKKTIEEMKLWANWIKELGRNITNTAATATAATSTDFRLVDRDIKEVSRYLQQIYLLRYNHLAFEGVGRNLKELATYVKWQVTKDTDLEDFLRETLGIHRVELEHLLQPRLDKMLQGLGIDHRFVKARLMQFEDVPLWVYGYKVMAHRAQWRELAKHLIEDKANFDDVFPGEIRYLSPETGIDRSNNKAMVHFGMMQLRLKYFARLNGPNEYKLSKDAEKLDREYYGVEPTERRGSARPGKVARLITWFDYARDAAASRHRKTV